MRAYASIGPYKWGLGCHKFCNTQQGKVAAGVRAPISSLRAEPVVRLASETRLRAQRPTAILWGGNT